MNHMGDLINHVFGGVQSKVIFGFCISDCSGTGSNVNSAQAVSITRSVNAQYPNHGGVFLWAASDDNGWSGPVAEALSASEGATPMPTPSPQRESLCDGEPCTDTSHCRSK